MNILIVYAHPQINSFNTALKDIAIKTLQQQGHVIKISDLYAMNFKATADWKDFMINPAIMPTQYSIAGEYATAHESLAKDILVEQEKLRWCDLLILQFPFWWFSMPAILKGWFDRVFTKGFAYEDGKWFDSAPLTGRKALVVTTTQGPEVVYQSDTVNGPMNLLLQPIHHTLHFTGFATYRAFISYGVMDDDEQKRQNYLQGYAKRLSQLERETLTPVPKLGK